MRKIPHYTRVNDETDIVTAWGRSKPDEKEGETVYRHEKPPVVTGKEIWKRIGRKQFEKVGDRERQRTRTVIMNDIMINVKDEEQLNRLLTAYNKRPAIAFALDNLSLEIAKSQVGLARTVDEIITKDDETYILKYMVEFKSEIGE